MDPQPEAGGALKRPRLAAAAATADAAGASSAAPSAGSSLVDWASSLGAAPHLLSLGLSLPAYLQLYQSQAANATGAQPGGSTQSLLLPVPLPAGAVQAAEAPPAAPAYGPGSGGSRSHSRGDSDSAQDGSGEAVQAGQEGQLRGRRTDAERLTATKEKNRRAQQRFRMRQKEKLQWLESELQRLRALCSRHHIDPSPNAPPPPTPMSHPEAAPQQPHAQAATAALGLAPAAGPSAQQMQEDLELMLETIPNLQPAGAIAYLTAFQRADPETRRLQYSCFKRRYDANKLADLATCIACFLGGGAPAVPAPRGGPPAAGGGEAV